ncbi:hypothetical protein PR048_009727 [Dryococelus australis]|uniref:Uncharacterized protein n=1 Tax=Dryococelus australis TaxID=614101 RepID=A0ABQ9I0S0_9NEOP|nr:hypothetical protein PR048_009727 [Dryococelus australis]
MHIMDPRLSPSAKGNLNTRKKAGKLKVVPSTGKGFSSQEINAYYSVELLIPGSAARASEAVRYGSHTIDDLPMITNCNPGRGQIGGVQRQETINFHSSDLRPDLRRATGVNVLTPTIPNRLHQEHKCAYKPMKCPSLSHHYRTEQLAWGHAHLDWELASLKRMLTDESHNLQEVSYHTTALNSQVDRYELLGTCMGDVQTCNCQSSNPPETHRRLVQTAQGEELDLIPQEILDNLICSMTRHFHNPSSDLPIFTILP